MGQAGLHPGTEQGTPRPAPLQGTVLERCCQLPSVPAPVRIVLEGRGSPGSGSPRSCAQQCWHRQPGQEREASHLSTAATGRPGIAAHGRTAHTHAHTLPDTHLTPLGPRLACSDRRQEETRDSAERFRSPGALWSQLIVLKKQPPEVVVAQLCKICGVFSVWQLQEGKTGLCVTGGGRNGSTVLCFQVCSWLCSQSGQGEREEEGGFLRGPRVHLILQQHRQGRLTLAKTEQLAAQKCCCCSSYHSHV